jgi:hypothetical protein
VSYTSDVDLARSEIEDEGLPVTIDVTDTVPSVVHVRQHAPMTDEQVRQVRGIVEELASQISWHSPAP